MWLATEVLFSCVSLLQARCRSSVPVAALQVPSSRTTHYKYCKCLVNVPSDVLQVLHNRCAANPRNRAPMSAGYCPIKSAQGGPLRGIEPIMATER